MYNMYTFNMYTCTICTHSICTHVQYVHIQSSDDMLFLVNLCNVINAASPTQLHNTVLI